MMEQDNDAGLHVPEEEKPLGTGQDDRFLTDGLATDPYADDMPFRVARPPAPRLLRLGIIVIVVVVLIVFALIAFRTWSRPPHPMPRGSVPALVAAHAWARQMAQAGT